MCRLSLSLSIPRQRTALLCIPIYLLMYTNRLTVTSLDNLKLQTMFAFNQRHKERTASYTCSMPLLRCMIMALRVRNHVCSVGNRALSYLSGVFAPPAWKPGEPHAQQLLLEKTKKPDVTHHHQQQPLQLSFCILTGPQSLGLQIELKGHTMMTRMFEQRKMTNPE